jgi:hypothetical protein
VLCAANPTIRNGGIALTAKEIEMSLFQCQHCGCAENTALSGGTSTQWIPEIYDWSGIEDRKGKQLCSVCSPAKFSDGQQTDYGKWHDRFDRVMLPKNEFETNMEGNLKHKKSGSTDFRKFAI